METRIKVALKTRKMTVHQMHQKVGGNRAYCYQVVSGFCRATVPMRERVSSVLGLPVDELFDEFGMARK